MAEAGDSSAPPKTTRLDFTKIINVRVGTAKKDFTVHQDIICGRSKFFEAACSPQWTQISKIIELPEDDPDSFQVYLHCLYQHKVDVGDLSSSLEGENQDCDDHARMWERLLRAYVLADKLGDIITANMIVYEFIHYWDRTNKMPDGYTVKLAFELTAEQSPIQRVLVDGYVHEATAQGIGARCHDGITPKAFLYRVLLEKAELEEERHPNEIVTDVYQPDFVKEH